MVVAYTYMGGMWSVTLTDMYQTGLLTLGLLIMLPIAISHVGGWDSFIANAANWAELPAFALVPTADAGYLGYFALPGWFYYIGAWMSIGFGSLCSQDLMQRTLSAKDEKTSVYAGYLAGVLYLTIGTVSYTHLHTALYFCDKRKLGGICLLYTSPWKFPGISAALPVLITPG